MYSNDLKAPRMKKSKYTEHVVTEDLYRAFKKKFPEYKRMKWREFSDKWNDIAETIRQEAITNPLGVKLGSYTGELKLQFHKPDQKMLNIPLSMKLGKAINYVNLLTRGKTASIRWERRWAVKFNKILQFFAFSPCRELHKMAKKQVDTNPDRLRMIRPTTGGFHVWTEIKKKL